MPPSRLETDYVQTGKTYVNCYCYARAVSNEESHVEDAVDRANNMAQQISSLVKLYTAQFPGAYSVRPAGMTEFKSWEIDPGFIAVVLVVEFEHDVSAQGAT
jgi:hypothetical protein